ncbi:MAG TPA: sigma-54 dependent transcriptional regulator, partial [Gemmatimonadaceae bacterium]|nr:sigma-54 dependent transcriptional regulator [Gemmatimonadaceae bacterium]
MAVQPTPTSGSQAVTSSLGTLLLIDDDQQVLNALSHLLERHGWRTVRANDPRTGVALYAQERPDLVICDVSMPGLTGLQVLEILKSSDADATVVMLTGNADIETAVESMRAGAENFLTKPWKTEHLLAAVNRAVEKATLRRMNRFLAVRQVLNANLETLGSSPAMRELAGQIQLLAAGNAPILLTGETGSGKGWASKLLHASSARAGAPFVSINCAGLTATFLDSELFGHEKGAFTDAKTQKPGLFELANTGTLMLDEIGDLSPELQPKLLTVLETQRFRRLGGTREIQVDVRLIAATHVDLTEAVKAGRFREDLFYRLAVLPLRIPSLRERGHTEIADLAIRLLSDHRRNLGRGPTKISTEALERIVSYAWPGNVRELRNVLERALLLAGSAEELEASHLPIGGTPARGTPVIMPAARSAAELTGDMTLATAERQHIERVLAHAKGNRALAARLLGVS